jgi:hypothetical protein
MILLEKVATTTTLGKSSWDFFRDLVLMKHPLGPHAWSPTIFLVGGGSQATSLTNVFFLLAFCVCMW